MSGRLICKDDATVIFGLIVICVVIAVVAVTVL